MKSLIARRPIKDLQLVSSQTSPKEKPSPGGNTKGDGGTGGGDLQD